MYLTIEHESEGHDCMCSHDLPRTQAINLHMHHFSLQPCMIFQSHCAVIAAKLGYVVNSQPFGDRIISLTVTDCHTYLYACMTLCVGDHTQVRVVEYITIMLPIKLLSLL